MVLEILRELKEHSLLSRFECKMSICLCARTISALLTVQHCPLQDTNLSAAKLLKC